MAFPMSSVPKKADILNLSLYLNGLMQDCSISIANALEILQSCSKPSISSNLDII